MPLYEYVCRDCGTAFEKLVQRFGDAVDCPSCSSAAVDKQLSVFAVATASPAIEGCEAGRCCAAGTCGAQERGGPAGPCGAGACGLPS